MAEDGSDAVSGALAIVPAKEERGVDYGGDVNCAFVRACSDRVGRNMRLYCSADEPWIAQSSVVEQ